MWKANAMLFLCKWHEITPINRVFVTKGSQVCLNWAFKIDGSALKEFRKQGLQTTSAWTATSVYLVTEEMYKDLLCNNKSALWRKQEVLETITGSDAEYKFYHFCVSCSNPENPMTQRWAEDLKSLAESKMWKQPNKIGVTLCILKKHSCFSEHRGKILILELKNARPIEFTLKSQKLKDRKYLKVLKN